MAGKESSARAGTIAACAAEAVRRDAEGLRTCRHDPPVIGDRDRPACSADPAVTTGRIALRIAGAATIPALRKGGDAMPTVSDGRDGALRHVGNRDVAADRAVSAAAGMMRGAGRAAAPANATL
ncbi:hypothetical protein [Bosea sp. (in: a-proteobacteria)]|uniref:hypothetical protein n=1 Tax=Bosea sp. (in: a-proteobacteria) TaxID=1871050 RepID=UPI003F6E6BA9